MEMNGIMVTEKKLYILECLLTKIKNFTAYLILALLLNKRKKEMKCVADERFVLKW